MTELVLYHTEEDIQEQLLNEREKDIIDIHKNVHLVHEIYQDIAKLVTDQQETVDDIEQNITSSLQDTNKGVEQLEKAKASQNKQFRCGIYMFFIILCSLFGNYIC